MAMNQKNPAIKRIMADVKELNQHPSSRYYAEPLENNMFEWFHIYHYNVIGHVIHFYTKLCIIVIIVFLRFFRHFTIRGPKDTAFEGGVYHGRILLPSEYPFKPPNIVFLTVSY